jgi:lipopolysaccharide biosynthesis glycosyltransferase
VRKPPVSEVGTNQDVGLKDASPDPPEPGDAATQELPSAENTAGNLGTNEFTTRQQERPQPIHVALIFTLDKVSEAGQAIRSLLFVTKARPLVVHALTTVAGWEAFAKEVDFYPHIVYYPLELCNKFVAPVLPFAHPSIHVVAHCRLFLANIISASVSRIMFMDNDVTANQDITACYDQPLKEDQLMGLGVDMGDICQFIPDMCWPVGFQNRGQNGLECGGLPRRNISGWVNKLRTRELPTLVERVKILGGDTHDLQSYLERERSRHVSQRPDIVAGSHNSARCIEGTGYEPAQVNAGVILMDLAKMRETRFVHRFVSSVIRTARRLDFKPARWGDQDFINNYFRLYPNHLALLPCGCNYQYIGPRRTIRCPKQPVYLVHSWHLGTSVQTTNVYNHLYFYFKNYTIRLLTSDSAEHHDQMGEVQADDAAAPNGESARSKSIGYLGFEGAATPVSLPLLTQSAIDSMEHVPIDLLAPKEPPNAPSLSPAWAWDRYVVAPFEYAGNARCPHQQHQCENIGMISREPVFHEEAVFVLTRSRTSLHAEQLWDQVYSLYKQSHGRIYHMIVLDASTKAFLQRRLSDTGISMERLIFLDRPSPSSTPVSWPGACKACEMSCSRAEERQYLDLSTFSENSAACFCTQQSGDADEVADYRILHTAVVSMRAELPSGGGWILYLEDVHIIPWRHAVAHMLGQARSRNDLLVFQSLLPHRSPSDQDFLARKLAFGKLSFGNFLFHSKHLHFANWSSGLECNEYRILSTLAAKLRTLWIEDIPVVLNPSLTLPQAPLASAATLGGAVAPSEVDSSLARKITVIIASYSLEGFRPHWLRDTVRRYTGPEFASLIDKVIVVWNNPDEAPPRLPEKAVILHQKVNSLNNRWIETLPHIRTDAVLNIDDDMYLERNALTCMLQWWFYAPMRLVGPVSRTVDEQGSYVLQDLRQGEPYVFMLPRAVLLHKNHLETYARSDEALRAYVDNQEAKCDDILLNFLVSTNPGGDKPLQVLLPPGSMFDRSSPCSTRFPTETGGLALQKDRQQLRSECFQHYMEVLQMRNLTYVQDFAHCEIAGHRGKLLDKPGYSDAFLAQFRTSMPCSLEQFEA